MTWLYAVDLALMCLLSFLAIFAGHCWGKALKREAALIEENAALYRLLAATTEDDLLEALTALQCAQDKQRRALGRKR